NAWMQIPGTTLASIEPSSTPPGNPARRVDAWCSMAYDPNRSRMFQVAGGGHSDYAGNEAEMLDLSQENPAWVRLRGATMSVQDSAYYADGTPTSRHHNNGIQYDPSTDRVVLLAGARYSDGFNLSTVDAFNLSSNTYSAAGTFPSLPGA